MADVNYFVCTLGQATEINQTNPHRYTTINEFVDHQADTIPDSLAVGFPMPSDRRTDETWSSSILTFKELQAHSLFVAVKFHEALSLANCNPTNRTHPQTLALLCSSSLEFLYTWLALMRLGYSVLLIAYAVMKTVWIAVTDTGVRRKDLNVNLQRFLIFVAFEAVPSSHHGFPAQNAGDTAFLFHTSGTSSGLPKPIPQSHHGAIGVLPSLGNGHKQATFTTTPLYHGGIADCFRAWTSGALIWLFPGKDVPITATNILKCLDCAKGAELSNHAAPVKFFSSVPYVLQMVSAEPAGMEMLQQMAVVGVGGAALPQDAGDALVQNDVNLVSRFGSAECGFLLSSHREYKEDKEWQYLRSHGSDLLKFEKQDDGSGLSELIIGSRWPHMAKRNREDRSFATADLFAPHPTIPCALKYHSRADSQLTLITGKKFDPAPLEAAIASSNLLNDALICGNGKPSPSALLFRSEAARTLSVTRLLDQIWPVIEKLNNEGQQHTKLSRGMLRVMNPEAPGPEKSSKGTILRAQALKMYEKEIEAIYEQTQNLVTGDHREVQENIPDHEVPRFILEIIKASIGTADRIPDDADLFSYGVDSVACMAIRAKLQTKILDPKAPTLPLNVVYDCGNIERLSKYLLDLRRGRSTQAEDEIKLMKTLVNHYSNIANAPPISEADDNEGILLSDKPKQDGGEHVLLTGATGALGAHILHLLRSSSTTSQITCLVRAASPLAAHERVSKSLIARGKQELPPFSDLQESLSHSSASTLNSTSEANPTRIICLPTTFSHPALGLDRQRYIHLARTTTLIIHAAWAVNFTARLRSFEKDHIAGLSYLLSFSLAYHPQHPRQHRLRFLFLSSTASVTSSPNCHTNPIPELPSQNPQDASPLGYSRSKWVAEQICKNFHDHLAAKGASTASNNPKIAVLRIGQLCGDTQNGIWNMSEAYPLMLSTAPALHALPDLGGMGLDWMPVDRAAKAVVDVAGGLVVEGDVGSGVRVLHILNPHTTPTWDDLITVIKDLDPSYGLRILPPSEWLRRLEGWEGDLPAKKLVGLWREAFSRGENDGGEDGGKDKGKKEGGDAKFEVSRAKAVSAVMQDLKPLDREVLGKMWRWVRAECGDGRRSGEIKMKGFLRNKEM
ncbi:MAG: hypothetical protein Q9219_002696 [cf. Caloplaca sp. 3 TL-2023]